MDHPIQLSGLFVRPIADRIREWCLDGKIDEDDLERALTSNARTLVDHAMDSADWATIEDVEGLVGLVADRMGGETALVEWADTIVEDWLEAAPVLGLAQGARRLVDAQGFVVSQASELLVREPDWSYDGSRSAFTVRLHGVAQASSKLKTLLGAILARLASAVGGAAFDVRVDGIDGDELVVFGERERSDDSMAESRLHRAALIA